MKKRNPVVRDLIGRPNRAAGRHKDRRRERKDEDRKLFENIFDKPLHKIF
jgi:hypothetical protein